MKKILIITIFCFFGLNKLISQNTIKALELQLQKTLDKIVTDYKIPGITMAIVFDASTTINLASGFNDVDKNIKMTPETRMLSGSVGKMFVSTIMLKLIEDKKITIDKKVIDYLGNNKWFDEIPNNTEITIRHLLNHTSGLPRYIFQPEFLKDIKSNPLADRSPESCLGYILNKPAIHKTGQGFAYSDTNYLLLGLIIEKITGKSYYDLLTQNILPKFQLNNTSPSTSRSLEGLSQGYIGNQNYFNLPKTTLSDNLLAINPTFEWTGGGVITTVKDLALFTKQLHESDYLNKQSKSKMIQAINMSTGQPYDQGYGLGSFIWSKQNDTRYGHAGFFPGYLSHVEYSKNRQYAIAIQVNTDEGYGLLQQYIYIIDSVILQHLDKIDEYKIKANFKKQEECWNNKDIECYMEAYARKEQIQTASRGGITYGYDNIISDYKKYFPKERMGKLHFDNLNLRRLSDNLYFVTGRFNLKFPNREELSQGWFSVNIKRINDEWKMITDHSS